MRSVLFYVLLFIPILGWSLVVLPNSFDEVTFISEDFVASVLRISPILGGDLSVFGEITPFILASAIISLMPPAREDLRYSSVVIMLFTYILYLYLSIYFSEGPGQGLLASVTEDLDSAQKKILAIVSNIRTMTLVMFASILGFKIKSGAKDQR